LAANVTDKYPRGVPATETSKKMAWKVALEFFIQNRSTLMPPLYNVPQELEKYSVEFLSTIGISLQDIKDGKENVCTILAKQKYNELILSKDWENLSN